MVNRFTTMENAKFSKTYHHWKIYHNFQQFYNHHEILQNLQKEHCFRNCDIFKSFFLVQFQLFLDILNNGFENFCYVLEVLGCYVLSGK